MLDININKEVLAKGHQFPILVLGTSNVNPYCTMSREWAKAIQSINQPTYIIDYWPIYMQRAGKGLEKYIEDFLSQHKVEAIYFQGIPFSEISLDFIEGLRQRYFIFSYLGDTFEYFEKFHRYSGQVLDLVLSESYHDKYKYKDYGYDALFIPSCYDTSIYRDLGPVERPIDVSFVGRLDRVGRKEYIGHLKRNGINVAVYGFGTELGPVNQSQMVEIFNKSKINLNFSGLSNIFNNRIESRLTQFKGRYIEVALTNSFALNEFVSDAGRYFEIGNEIDIFNNKQELLEKIKFYLGNEAERKRITKNGYARALRDYDSKAVWNKLLYIIKNKKESKIYSERKIYLGKDYNKFFSLHKLNDFYRFVKNGRFNLGFQTIAELINSGNFNILQFFTVSISSILKDAVNQCAWLKKAIFNLRNARTA